MIGVAVSLLIAAWFVTFAMFVRADIDDLIDQQQDEETPA